MRADEQQQLEENKERIANSPYLGVVEAVWIVIENFIVAFVLRALVTGRTGAQIISYQLRPFVLFLGFMVWFMWRKQLPGDFRFLGWPSTRIWRFAACIGLLAAAMWLLGGNVLCLDNVRSPASGWIDWALVSRYTLFGPIQEELLFRCLALSAVWKRSSRMSPESRNRFLTVASGLLFGAMHLSNLIGVPLNYVMMQAALSTLAGASYTWSVLKSGNISDAIFAHLANNLLAVWVPTTRAGEPAALFSVVGSVMIHLSLFIN